MRFSPLSTKHALGSVSRVTVLSLSSRFPFPIDTSRLRPRNIRYFQSRVFSPRNERVTLATLMRARTRMTNPVPLILSPFTRFFCRDRGRNPRHRRTSADYHGERSTEGEFADRGSRIGDDCAQLSAANECVADAFASSDFASR